MLGPCGLCRKNLQQPHVHMIIVQKIYTIARKHFSRRRGRLRHRNHHSCFSIPMQIKVRALIDTRILIPDFARFPAHNSEPIMPFRYINRLRNTPVPTFISPNPRLLACASTNCDGVPLSHDTSYHMVDWGQKLLMTTRRDT